MITSKCLAIDYQNDVKPILKKHCYSCHAGENPKSDFGLDTGKSLLAGGKRGAVIVPGNVEKSALIEIIKGRHDQIPQMPFRRDALTKSEIETLQKWIEGGASFPENEVADHHVHWAFRSIISPDFPEESGFEESNPIDRFIRHRLSKKGLTPSPPAKPEVLLRRLYLDITGIIPKPEEIDDYLKDDLENATERQIDKLLSSVRFGERWGRHWLDLARYADSNGYSIDSPRSIWRYRDYVIDAFNENLPFDQFVIEQLAGDLIPNPTIDQLIATGFHRNTQINQEGGIDKEQFRIEAIVDRVSTTGTAFLGLTISCAQCHDHKFDPISQTEYYELFAFFNNQDEPNLPTPRMEEVEAIQKYEDEIKRIKAEIEKIEKGKVSKSSKSSKGSKHFAEKNSSKQAFERQLRELQKRRPHLSTTMILREREAIRPTYIHIKGDFTRQGREVFPNTPKVLGRLKFDRSSNSSSSSESNSNSQSSKSNRSSQSEKSEMRANRLSFSHWLTSSKNPLLARVLVNRIWQQYFGRGIVETENDFGTQGTPPSHPALLDWLANELIEGDWNVKALHKKILMSSTYQQSSIVKGEAFRLDPDNRLFGRQSRRRLESEIIRDVALSVAGLLSDKIGGPSVHPPQPSGVMKLGQVQRNWQADLGEDRYRRGLYTFFWRATPHPALSVFDSPDAFATCSRRIVSNTPLQALTLLNDPAFFELAIAFAKRIQNLSCQDENARIRESFRLCLSRYPSELEMQQINEFLNDQSEIDKSEIHKSHNDQFEIDQAEQLIFRETKIDPRWLMLARVLLNLDETITRE